MPNITKTENLSEIENTLVITTNKGNNNETQYEIFDGFKIKIPSEFKIMNDEIVNVKYPNRMHNHLFLILLFLYLTYNLLLYIIKNYLILVSIYYSRIKVSEFPINLEQVSRIELPAQPWQGRILTSVLHLRK